MLITIDTELQVIVVPKEYSRLLNNWNDMVAGVGGRRVDSNQFLRLCFDAALSNQVVTEEEHKALRP